MSAAASLRNFLSMDGRCTTGGGSLALLLLRCCVASSSSSSSEELVRTIRFFAGDLAAARPRDPCSGEGVSMILLLSVAVGALPDGDERAAPTAAPCCCCWPPIKVCMAELRCGVGMRASSLRSAASCEARSSPCTAAHVADNGPLIMFMFFASARIELAPAAAAAAAVPGESRLLLLLLMFSDRRVGVVLLPWSSGACGCGDTGRAPAACCCGCWCCCDGGGGGGGCCCCW